MTAQKTSVATARPKVTMLHGIHAIVIIFDTLIIVSQQALQTIVLKTTTEIETTIVTHAIAVLFAHVAVLAIDTIAGITITSQTLVIVKARTTMLNTETDLDLNHGHDHGPVLVNLGPQDTIMVIIITMTSGEENGHPIPLASQVRDRNNERPLLGPNLLQFNKMWLLT